MNKLALPYLMYLARTQPDISTQAMVSVLSICTCIMVSVFLELCCGPVYFGDMGELCIVMMIRMAIHTPSV